ISVPPVVNPARKISPNPNPVHIAPSTMSKIISIPSKFTYCGRKDVNFTKIGYSKDPTTDFVVFSFPKKRKLIKSKKIEPTKITKDGSIPNNLYNITPSPPTP